MKPEIKVILDETAARVNVQSFADNDPVQFPRRFSDLRDIEIVSFLVSHISWGRRDMILRDAERLMAMMEGQPYRWIMERGYLVVPDDVNIHRTFFGRNLKHICRGLELLFNMYPTMHEYARRAHIESHDAPAWAWAACLQDVIEQANHGCKDNRGLPSNLDSSALKRLNMCLRWLVRNDGIVDMGVWTALQPKDLFIPLDVHVGDTARRLGLLTRCQNDKKSVLELTGCLRELRPDDPCYYDFALFGMDFLQADAEG